MDADERAIRDLIQTWLTASAAGDLDRVLALMSDDIVFLTPGQAPFGKKAFAAVSRASVGKVRVEATSEVQEVQVVGEVAYARSHLTVTVSPIQDVEPKRLSGYTLSVFRKTDGQWIMMRDANLLTPEPRGVRAAVPVFQVVSVAKAIIWYRDVLGFTANPFGPPDEPVFAILHRDSVELMLQKSREGHTRTVGWNAYIRVTNVERVRESVLVKLGEVEPIVTRAYGCREFTLTDPDGNLLVIAECG